MNDKGLVTGKPQQRQSPYIEIPNPPHPQKQKVLGSNRNQLSSKVIITGTNQAIRPERGVKFSSHQSHVTMWGREWLISAEAARSVRDQKLIKAWFSYPPNQWQCRTITKKESNNDANMPLDRAYALLGGIIYIWCGSWKGEGGNLKVQLSHSLCVHMCHTAPSTVR